jgi:hypothetical protein
MTDPSNIIVEWDALHRTDATDGGGIVVHVADATYVVADEPDVRTSDGAMPSSGDWAVRRTSAPHDDGEVREVFEYFALRAVAEPTTDR